MKRMRLGVRVTCPSSFLYERQTQDGCFQFKSESRTMMAYSSPDSYREDKNTVLRTQRYPAIGGIEPANG